MAINGTRSKRPLTACAVADVKAFAIRYIGLTYVYAALAGFLNFDSFTIGVWLTTIFGAVVVFLGPVLLATLTMHFVKKEF